VSYLSDSFSTGQRIRFDLAIEPLEMDVSQAVPLGLILNEAITNSIKYAFPDGRNGVISISISSATPSHYLLSISDNGIGIPTGFFSKQRGSLGMSLMAGLSKGKPPENPYWPVPMVLVVLQENNVWSRMTRSVRRCLPA
jgi:two-component sensor histidine kinase